MALGELGIIHDGMTSTKKSVESGKCLFTNVNSSSFLDPKFSNVNTLNIVTQFSCYIKKMSSLSSVSIFSFFCFRKYDNLKFLFTPHACIVQPSVFHWARMRVQVSHVLR